MEERVPLTARQTSSRSYPSEVRGSNCPIIDEGSLELLEHLIAIVLQGNTQYLATLLRNEEILDILDLHDNKGFTALHIAAERVDPESVRLLLEADANPNVMDRFRRTALHWAVSGGCHCDFCNTKRAKCVELLLRAKANLEIMDVKQETPLSYAAKNKFHKAARLMLEHGSEISQTCNGVSVGELIIQRIPELMTHLLDQSVAYDRDDNSKLKIDFSVLVQSPQTSKNVSEEENQKERGKESLEGDISRRRQKAKPEMELLNSFLESSPPIRAALLTHPVTAAFLHLKWIYVRKWVWFIRCLHWVINFAYTKFIIKLYFLDCPYEEQSQATAEAPISEENATDAQPQVDSNLCKPDLELFILAIFMGSWAGLMIFSSLYTMMHGCKSYFTALANVGWWILFGIVTLTVLPVFGILDDYWIWQYIIAVVGVLWAWIMNLSNISDIPLFGAYIKILMKTLRRLVTVVIAYSSIFIAFILGYYFLFPKNHATALIRAFLLMLGQGGNMIIFDHAENLRLESPEHWIGSIELTSMNLHAYYLGFMALFGLVVINLLIALAVYDVQKLQAEGEVAYISSQIAAISHLESMVADSWFGSCIQQLILSRISVQCRNGRYFRFSPLDPKDGDKSLPTEVKIKFLPLLHTRDCLNKNESQRPIPSLNQNFGFHRNEPARGSTHTHSQQGQRNFAGAPPDNIDEILNELKLKLEGLQRSRIVAGNPIYC